MQQGDKDLKRKHNDDQEPNFWLLEEEIFKAKKLKLSVKSLIASAFFIANIPACSVCKLKSGNRRRLQSYIHLLENNPTTKLSGAYFWIYLQGFWSRFYMILTQTPSVIFIQNRSQWGLSISLGQRRKGPIIEGYIISYSLQFQHRPLWCGISRVLWKALSAFTVLSILMPCKALLIFSFPCILMLVGPWIQKTFIQKKNRQDSGETV